jgi:predicted dehydrogenase
MSYTVMFERATVDYDSARGDAALQVWEEGKEPAIITPEGPDGYVGELQHLIASIRSGTAPTIVTAHDGLSAVEICEAEEKSVATGQVVSL